MYSKREMEVTLKMSCVFCNDTHSHTYVTPISISVTDTPFLFSIHTIAKILYVYLHYTCTLFTVPSAMMQLFICNDVISNLVIQSCVSKTQISLFLWAHGTT